jgi:hypothetical protein
MHPLPPGSLQRATEVSIAAFGVLVSSGIAAGVYRLLDSWIRLRVGRKLKIKVGEVEMEATQMNEADVLRIFELLEEKADRKKIRDALLEANARPPAGSR